MPVKIRVFVFTVLSYLRLNHTCPWRNLGLDKPKANLHHDLHHGPSCTKVAHALQKRQNGKIKGIQNNNVQIGFRTYTGYKWTKVKKVNPHWGSDLSQTCAHFLFPCPRQQRGQQWGMSCSASMERVMAKDGGRCCKAACLTHANKI